MGAVGGALGIGGTLGGLLSGINVGGSGTSGTSVSNTTYLADQPRISLAPKSNGAMSKRFHITGVGKRGLETRSGIHTNMTDQTTNCKFSVCISYSLDEGRTFKKIVTDFFVNSHIVIPVAINGRVNNALREIYTVKPDALNETWWLLHFKNNVPGYNSLMQGMFYDYQ